METSWSRPGARRYDGVLLQSPCRCSLIPRAVTMPVDRLHVEPFWEAVLRMNKLTCPTFHLLDQNGCPDSAAPFSMLRFQTRNMAKLDLGSAQVRGMYQVFGVCDSVEDHERLRIPPEASGCFTMYHFTDIGNLLSGCPSGHPSLPLTGQDGILRDGGLRFGTFHGDGIGVYICFSSCVVEPFLAWTDGHAGSSVPPFPEAPQPGCKGQVRLQGSCSGAFCLWCTLQSRTN